MARSLSNLAVVLQAQGEHSKALVYLEQAVTMYQRLTSAFADTASEAEALIFLSAVPRTRDALLTLTAQRPASAPQDHYPALWQTRAALIRILAP